MKAALVRVALLAALVTVATPCGGKSAKKDPVALATSHYRMAQAMVKSGRIQEALVELEQAIELSAPSADMENFHGQLLLLAGRYPPAEKALQKALELDPYLTDAHNNLGALYDRQGKKTEAEAEYRKALADPAYPTPQKVHLNLGLLFSSQGREEDAIHELRKAVEIDPKYYQAHYELAARLEAKGSLEEAAREYEVAAPEYRLSGEYHYRLGVVYLRLGDKAKAGDHLRKVQDISPGSENAARADEMLKMVR